MSERECNGLAEDVVCSLLEEVLEGREDRAGELFKEVAGDVVDDVMELVVVVVVDLGSCVLSPETIVLPTLAQIASPYT